MRKLSKARFENLKTVNFSLKIVNDSSELLPHKRLWLAGCNFQRSCPWVGICSCLLHLRILVTSLRMSSKASEKEFCSWNSKNDFYTFKLTSVIFSFGRFGKSFISTNEVMTPSNVPNCESIPSVNNIRKNKTAQIWAPGNWLMASVKMMNARPVPDALLLSSSSRLHFSSTAVGSLAYLSVLRWLHSS